jgi:hypothetical protein
MAKKKTDIVDTGKKVSNDDLASFLKDAINSSSKEGTVAYFLGSEETPTDLTDFVSTGSDILDLAISNRPNGGICPGKIYLILGWEGCVTEDTLIDVIIE